jgi:hypothetical protein
MTTQGGFLLPNGKDQCPVHVQSCDRRSSSNIHSGLPLSEERVGAIPQGYSSLLLSSLLPNSLAE